VYIGQRDVLNRTYYAAKAAAEAAQSSGYDKPTTEQISQAASKYNVTSESVARLRGALDKPQSEKELGYSPSTATPNVRAVGVTDKQTGHTKWDWQLISVVGKAPAIIEGTSNPPQPTGVVFSEKAFALYEQRKPEIEQYYAAQQPKFIDEKQAAKEFYSTGTYPLYGGAVSVQYTRPIGNIPLKEYRAANFLDKLQRRFSYQKQIVESTGIIQAGAFVYGKGSSAVNEISRRSNIIIKNLQANQLTNLGMIQPANLIKRGLYDMPTEFTASGITTLMPYAEKGLSKWQQIKPSVGLDVLIGIKQYIKENPKEVFPLVAGGLLTKGIFAGLSKYKMASSAITWGGRAALTGYGVGTTFDILMTPTEMRAFKIGESIAPIGLFASSSLYSSAEKFMLPKYQDRISTRRLNKMKEPYIPPYQLKYLKPNVYEVVLKGNQFGDVPFADIFSSPKPIIRKDEFGIPRPDLFKFPIKPDNQLSLSSIYPDEKIITAGFISTYQKNPKMINIKIKNANKFFSDMFSIMPKVSVKNGGLLSEMFAWPKKYKLISKTPFVIEELRSFNLKPLKTMKEFKPRPDIETDSSSVTDMPFQKTKLWHFGFNKLLKNERKISRIMKPFAPVTSKQDKTFQNIIQSSNRQSSVLLLKTPEVNKRTSKASYEGLSFNTRQQAQALELKMNPFIASYQRTEKYPLVVPETEYFGRTLPGTRRNEREMQNIVAAVSFSAMFKADTRTSQRQVNLLRQLSEPQQKQSSLPSVDQMIRQLTGTTPKTIQRQYQEQIPMPKIYQKQLLRIKPKLDKIPPNINPIIKVPIIPFFRTDFDILKQIRKQTKPKRKLRYQPSLVGIDFARSSKIFGKAPKILTGIEIRYMKKHGGF